MKQRVLQVARQAALEAGKLLAPASGRLQTRQIRRKSTNNYVTEIDHRSERFILETVRRAFPEHGFLAEESGASAGRLPAGRQEITWIIDPIDGTSNFIHGFPLYAISIGVARRERVFAGVVYDPANGELFSAVEGGGAFLNGKRIRVSSTAKLADGLVATGIPFRSFGRFAPYMRSFRNISLASAGIRRGGSAALDLAYVACGRVDGYWETHLSAWDIAAGGLIVREAGGKVSDLWGGNAWLRTGDIVASNGKIHREIEEFAKTIPQSRSRSRVSAAGVHGERA